MPPPAGCWQLRKAPAEQLAERPERGAVRSIGPAKTYGLRANTADAAAVLSEQAGNAANDCARIRAAHKAAAFLGAKQCRCVAAPHAEPAKRLLRVKAAGPLKGKHKSGFRRHNVGGNRTATLAAKPRPAVVVPR